MVVPGATILSGFVRKGGTPDLRVMGSDTTLSHKPKSPPERSRWMGTLVRDSATMKGGPPALSILSFFGFFLAETQHFLFWNTGFDPVSAPTFGPVKGFVRPADDLVGAQLRLRLADADAHGHGQ